MRSAHPLKDPQRKKIRFYVALVLAGLFVLHLALLGNLYDMLRGQF